MNLSKPSSVKALSPERIRIAKIFKIHIEKAIDELGPGYTVTLQGEFEKTPIAIHVEVSTKEREIP